MSVDGPDMLLEKNNIEHLSEYPEENSGSGQMQPSILASEEVIVLPPSILVIDFLEEPCISAGSDCTTIKTVGKKLTMNTERLHLTLQSGHDKIYEEADRRWKSRQLRRTSD